MNLQNMIEGKALLEQKDQIKKIFFYRICGTGMGACACLLKEAGFSVEGADTSFSPPMSTYLDSTGIPCFDLKDVNKKFLEKYDLIVVGNSVPRNSDQAKMIEECGVAFTSFPSIMGAFVLKDKNVIGVAGTHGKTTTTYFMTQILENLGLKPGYFIGGILDDRPPSTIGRDDYFIIESDEYDSAYFQKYSKFRLYELNHMILTSLEFDHGDIYDSIEDIEKEFEAVLPNINKFIIANDDYPSILKLHKKYKSDNWAIYGETSKLGPSNLDLGSNGSSFDLEFKGEVNRFKTNVVGKHNILNIASCLHLLLKDGFKAEDLQKALNNLGLVKRRQEVRGHYQGSIVIDDFAHHPKAIDLTIDAIKTKYVGREVVTVFEPVSATARSSYFQDEFSLSLKKSDKVIIAKNSLQTTVSGGENLDCNKLVSTLENENTPAFCAEDLNSLRAKIDEWIKPNSVLLVLSNRTCIGLWESDFVKELN